MKTITVTDNAKTKAADDLAVIKGKDINQMSLAELKKLVSIMAQMLGIADEFSVTKEKGVKK